MKHPSLIGIFATSLIMLWGGIFIYSWLCLPFLSTAVIFSCGWVLIGVVALERRTVKSKLEQQRKKEKNEAEAKAKMEMIAEEKKRMAAEKAAVEADAAAAVAKAQVAADEALAALNKTNGFEELEIKGSSAKSLDAGQIRVRTGIQYKVVTGTTPTGCMPTTAIQKVMLSKLPLAEATVEEDSTPISIQPAKESFSNDSTAGLTGPLSKKGSGSYHLKHAC